MMLPPHASTPPSPFRTRAPMARSGSCPTLTNSKPRAFEHDIRASSILARGNNVWASRRPGACQTRTDAGLWTLRQFSYKTLKQNQLVHEVSLQSQPADRRAHDSHAAASASSPLWQVGGRLCDRSGSGWQLPCKHVWEAACPEIYQQDGEHRRAGLQHMTQALTVEDVSNGVASPASGSHGSPTSAFASRKTTPLVHSADALPLRGVTEALPRVRVAIVGAGPVGLWVAVLLARAHARLFSTSSGFRISRLPGAPAIHAAWPVTSCLAFQEAPVVMNDSGVRASH